MIHRTGIFLALGGALLCVAAVQAQFTAYNDVVWRNDHAPLQPNVTLYGIGNGFTGQTSGLLKDFTTGVETPVTATFTQSGGVNWQPDLVTGGADCDPGTDAWSVFNPNTASLKGVVYYGSTGWWVDLRISGLNPNKTYSFVTSANRNEVSYTDRFTKYTLSGVDSFLNTSTPGVIIGDGGLSTTFNTGWNTTNGYVARWEEINPGVDGIFNIRAEATAAQYKAYAFSAFRLVEVPEPSAALLLIAALPLLRRR